jgi:hypothetical protein
VRGSGFERLDAIENVVFVGYPNGMYDTKNLTPIMRTGITATHPALDYCGDKAFLIDASVFPGSSGSPVFIVNNGAYVNKGSGIAMVTRALFLGVLSDVFVRQDEGEIKIENIPTRRRMVPVTEQMIDLGYVIKAERIEEAILAFLDRAKAIAHD